MSKQSKQRTTKSAGMVNYCCLKIIEEEDLIMINETDKCTGKWTKINLKNKEEKAILDYVITTKELYQQTENMIIDEQELLKLSGSRPSDHNTILLEINIPKIRSATKKKKYGK